MKKNICCFYFFLLCFFAFSQNTVSPFWGNTLVKQFASNFKKQKEDRIPHCFNGWDTNGFYNTSKTIFTVIPTAENVLKEKTEIGTGSYEDFSDVVLIASAATHSADIYDDARLPLYFQKKGINLRVEEKKVIPLMDSDKNFIKAAEPIRYSINDFKQSAKGKKVTYNSSIYSYICKENPCYCIQLVFNDDDPDAIGLEIFDVYKRQTPFAAGEEFFFYPGISGKKDTTAWNAMSEYEQYFCMLSEPLIAYNTLDVFSINPEKTPRDGKGTQKVSEIVLERDWECHWRGDILELLEKYRTEEFGYVPMYNRLNALLDKYPKQTVEQISVLECLDILETTRLFYIKQMREKLGEYGMLAWDTGRLLAVLRWGIAVGWLSEYEAKQYAKPLIDKLLNAYWSWDDYIAHYVIGRGLFALSTGKDIEEYEYKALKSAYLSAPNYENINRKYQFSLRGIDFPAEYQNKNPVLTYDDVWYKQTADAKAWSEFNALSSDFYTFYKKDLKSLSTQDELKLASIKKALTSFYNKKKAIPCVSLLMIEYQELTSCPKEKLIKYYDMALESFKKAVPAKHGLNSGYELFRDFSMAYISRMLNAKDWKRLDAFLSYLDDENTTDEEMCALYGIYYFIRMKTETDNNKVTKYRKKAVTFFKRIPENKLFTEEKILKDLEKKLSSFF